MPNDDQVAAAAMAQILLPVDAPAEVRPRPRVRTRPPVTRQPPAGAPRHRPGVEPPTYRPARDIGPPGLGR